ncbi:MAG: MipA/OmpV family protein, partial [Alphaproteobacteria bacterium]|nr:MipA/OmpV family protein [Alphaproteobacteria bacterium]
ITYRNTIFLNGREGFGVYAYRDRLITLGASIWMRGGRDEDDSDRLRGLGDIDTAAQARVFGRLAIGRARVGATLARDLGGSDGFTIDLNLSADFRPFERLTVSPGVGTTIGDNRYVMTWFGVTPSQAARSTLPAYDAGAGFVSLTGFVRANYALTDHWGIGAVVAVQRLLGDAADSPITERRTSPSGILSLSYRF